VIVALNRTSRSTTNTVVTRNDSEARCCRHATTIPWPSGAAPFGDRQQAPGDDGMKRSVTGSEWQLPAAIIAIPTIGVGSTNRQGGQF
jgi:hypothetical protein